MTNAEVARYFASLPADEPAEIHLANDDLPWCEKMEIVATNGVGRQTIQEWADEEYVPSDNVPDIGQPIIWETSGR